MMTRRSLLTAVSLAVAFEATIALIPTMSGKDVIRQTAMTGRIKASMKTAIPPPQQESNAAMEEFRIGSLPSVPSLVQKRSPNLPTTTRRKGRSKSEQSGNGEGLAARHAMLKLGLTSLLPVPFVLAHAISATSLPDFVHSLSTDTKLESIVLNDLSHVVVDLFSLWNPERLLLRLASMLGRGLVLGSDYLPDHKILPDELAFQMGMLGVTLWQVVSGVIENTKAPETTSFQDRVAFQKLFRPVGVTWWQYRKLMASAMEWVEVPPGTVLSPEEASSIVPEDGKRKESEPTADTMEEYLYWLYKGDTDMIFHEDAVHRVNAARSRQHEEDLGLLGDVHFSKHLSKMALKESSNRMQRQVRRDYQLEGDRDIVPPTTIRSGPKGATYLRLRTKELLRLMEEDESLGASVQSLLMQGMRKKLSFILRSS